MSKPMQPRGSADAMAALKSVESVINDAPEAQQTPAEPPRAQKPDTKSDWRVLPKKIPYKQINIRIRADLYEAMRELALYTEGESMNSIAGRAIEKEIAVMLSERGERPKRK